MQVFLICKEKCVTVTYNTIQLPASMAASLASTLSPIRRTTSGDGPINRIPASITAWAKSDRSDRNPYPGWMASTPFS